ncbi:anthocyanidin 3-O-glucosyltransferase 2-like [Coffea eugenioides]|uniref:Glycosyltransferase n=1 Tax=Coffea arabica TaxID=13443 RepID=A0A6P6S928_COFAR|nr:anthocyanidin 3-O-glucosyltransferase 2-like [Coffea arabica]XP_027127738.1 anthocyanidin 3-O-glucosyltransferase 2-like [Coffea arabica]XP_027171606.1 anthocyanidin 3-O-glucosyltransferase 2-like [Coffea eugenioides]XP_027171610.1 anthocyanidin 3-O-glucosyltransferase 2-like [Coffea eugenioides]
MKKPELVFIPSAGMGHLASTVELAKLLIDHNEHLSITVLIMKFPFETKVISNTDSQAEASDSRIRFVELKKDESASQTASPSLFLYQFIEDHKNRVRDVLAEISSSASFDLAGIVIDMFCTSMIDVANEFGVPSYVFYTSGAAMLGLVFHLQSLRDDFKEDVTDFENSKVELAVPTYINLVPVKVLPSGLFDKEGGNMFLNQAKRYRETKGIIVNTFLELESHAIQALSNDKTIPPVYAVGPVLNLKGSNGQNQETEIIMKWLDLQPDCSVVFLCFGSEGCFDGDQVKEIAHALERSGYPFLWSLRRPPPKGKFESPGEYENPEEVLPDGFLQRTAEVGIVIGWAPQAAVLSHPAVGGFVSHCGWNSTLESVWYGVPMATWPLHAEQQVNAFQMLKDLGMAVEIKMDFKKKFLEPSTEIVAADVIEKAIKHLMDPENEIRKKVKEMKERSRLTLNEGGASSASLGSFLDDVIHYIQ